MLVIDLTLNYPKMLHSVSEMKEKKGSQSAVLLLSFHNKRIFSMHKMSIFITKIAPNSSRPHDVFFKRLRRTSATGDIRFGDGNI